MALTGDSQKKTTFNFEIEIPADSRQIKSTVPTWDNSLDPLFNQEIRQESADHQDVPRCSIPAIENIKLPSPPDGGYGWMVVLGSFVMHIIIGSLERLDGVFFLQFQAKFNENAQLTAWPGAITSTLRMFLAPVAAALSNRYSIRTCCMMGSLLNFIGLLLNSFAPNFYFLFFSHTLLQGCGRGLLYAPCLIIINSYFDKKRSLAVGLATSGVGVGSFIFLPVTQLLFDIYGFSGAFLIISACTLNSFVVAMLYRPLTLQYKFTRAKENWLISIANQNMNDSSTTEDNKDKHSGMINPDIKGSISVQSKDSKQDTPAPSSSHGFVHQCNSCVTSIFWTCFPKEDSAFVQKSNKKVFHFYLLKDPSFLLFCLSIMLFTAAFKSAFTFIPPLVKSKGFTETEAAFIISITGVLDTLGRIGVGLCDLNLLRPCRPLFYILYIIIVALVSFIYPSLTSYMSLSIMSSIYGLFSGAYVAQKSVVIVDILGAENMAISFGMLVCFQGFGSAVGPPLSGAFKDIFRSFTEVFYLGGVLMCIACLLMVSSNFFLRRKRQKNGKESESDKDIEND